MIENKTCRYYNDPDHNSNRCPEPECAYSSPREAPKEMYRCQSYYDDSNILRDCTCGKCEQEEVKECEPTAQDLISEDFNRVWNTIKNWDISREPREHRLYAGATGTDVMTILNALKKPSTSTPEKGWEDLREKLADIEHERWSKWQRYCHSKMTEMQIEDRKYLILPVEFYDRWERQINTPYSKLSEKEKDSDREQVDAYLPLIRNELASQREEILKKIKDAK